MSVRLNTVFGVLRFIWCIKVQFMIHILIYLITNFASYLLMVQTLKKSFTIQVTCRTPKRKAEDTKHKAWVEAKKHRYMTAPGLSAVDVLIFGWNYNNRWPEMGKRKEKYLPVPSFKIQLWKFVRYLPCDTSTQQWCLYATPAEETPGTSRRRTVSVSELWPPHSHLRSLSSNANYYPHESRCHRLLTLLLHFWPRTSCYYWWWDSDCCRGFLRANLHKERKCWRS